MPYTHPMKTQVAGTTILSADWNTYVRDNIDFLANRPACRVYHNTTQSINDNAETTVAFNSERYDVDAMHDTVTANSRITFNTAGLYLVQFQGSMTAGTDYSVYYAGIRINAGLFLAFDQHHPNAISGFEYFVVNTTFKFAAADFVEVRVYQDNTANAARNLLSTANYTPEFTATWIGRG